MTVTLETLRADYNEVDFEIVDLFEQLRLAHVRNGSQTALFYEDMTKLFTLLKTLPIERACPIVCHLVSGMRIYFDPGKVPNWDEYSSRATDYILQTDHAHEDGRRWFKEATLALIAARFGNDAALLYKLSEGAIDPRVQP